jgi:hypothetical protein
MGKYEPLKEFLRKQRASEVRMSFGQIEQILGAKLPPKAQRHRAWWSNSASNSVMTKAWLEAGFRSERVDLAGRKLVFRRVSGQGSLLDDTAQSQERRPAISKRHPQYGAMRGLVRIAPGTDLTEPADPEWGNSL